MVNGSLSAAYEYDGFGQVIRESGPEASYYALRYSTKYTDIETGLVYYGLRYYSPTLGRFINKDPAEEGGGLNLYGFCLNNSVNGWDYLGQVFQIQARDGTFHISVPLTFAEGTPSNIQTAFARDVMRRWTGEFGSNRVTMTTYTVPASANIPTNTVVLIPGTGKAYTRPAGGTYSASSPTTIYWDPTVGSAPAHEIGHVLTLKDEYASIFNFFGLPVVTPPGQGIPESWLDYRVGSIQMTNGIMAAGNLPSPTAANIEQIIENAFGGLTTDGSGVNPVAGGGNFEYRATYDPSTAPNWLTSDIVASTIYGAQLTRIDPLADNADFRNDLALGEAFRVRNFLAPLAPYLSGDAPSGTLPGLMWRAFQQAKAGQGMNAVSTLSQYQSIMENKATVAGKQL